MNRIKNLALVLLLLTSTASGAGDVVVKALFKDSAVIVIDGQQKVLRAGGSYAGVTLISADSKAATVEIDGERKQLAIGRHMGANYSAPERTEVRIASHTGGHYFTPGRINNRPVRFLVDTGATTVAMNSLVAGQLGIDYRSGEQQRVQTASGTVVGWRVNLSSVSIGNLVLHNVDASVLEGAYPQQVLLGNSYLSRVDMQVKDGVLVLQTQF